MAARLSNSVRVGLSGSSDPPSFIPIPCHESARWQLAHPAGCDMRAVLDVVGRPIPFSRLIVPLAKQCVESFEHQRFVLLFNRLVHFILLLRMRGLVSGLTDRKEEDR